MRTLWCDVTREYFVGAWGSPAGPPYWLFRVDGSGRARLAGGTRGRLIDVEFEWFYAEPGFVLIRVLTDNVPIKELKFFVDATTTERRLNWCYPGFPAGVTQWERLTSAQARRAKLATEH